MSDHQGQFISDDLAKNKNTWNDEKGHLDLFQSWKEYNEMAKTLVWDSCSSVSAGFMGHWLRWGKWYDGRKTEIQLYSPFASYLMNKKWWLQEELALHLLRFQQVTFDQLHLFLNINSRQDYWSLDMIRTSLFLKRKKRRSLKSMEHFYLPLVILFGGLFLSTICFIVEIIIHRQRQRNGQL